MMGVRELNDNSVGQDAENLFLQKLKVYKRILILMVFINIFILGNLWI